MNEENKNDNFKDISIEIPKGHYPGFSNSAKINVSNDNVVLQFVYIRPNDSSGAMVSEVVLTPKHAISLQKKLNDTLKKHFTKDIEE